jgi:cell division protein FtsZ
MSNEELEGYSFDLPKNRSNVIKVIGVGGGGSNAIKHMFNQGIVGVDFIICNTDAQALDNSPVPNRIQLGLSLTEGLGAGANPDVGEHAAQESIEAIKAMLDSNTKMVFITAGMGGGTGTGAAPVIAKAARELDILTVGIVTTPFQFEGKVRNEQAQQGIEKLRRNVDSLIIINNNKLREVYGNLGFKAGFSKADEVLATASRGIAEVITNHYTQNIDLRDAKTVLANSGTAIMGSSTASGESRAQDAILKALDSPLLNDNKIKGAKNVLLLIVSGNDEITIDEIAEINDHIQAEAGGVANIIMGVGEDESLGDSIAVTVIATGFNVEQQNQISNLDDKRIIHTLEDEQRASHVLNEVKANATHGTIIMDLEDEFALEDVVDNAAAHTELDCSEETKSTPAITQATQTVVEKVVVYELIDEEEELFAPQALQENALIPTTEFIKNLNVIFEEVLDQENISMFVRPESAAIKVIVEDDREEERDQMFFDFDMPLLQNGAAVPKRVVHDLSDINVKDAVEVIPVTEFNNDGVRKYSLDDYMDFENELNAARPNTAVPPGLPVENAFVKKEVLPVESQHKGDETAIMNPLEMPINEVLKQRAEERRAKLHQHNFKFKNSHGIDELEKKPAFQRQGIELNDTSTSSDRSRTTLHVNDKDGVQFRTNNNSFLHDNVD